MPYYQSMGEIPRKRHTVYRQPSGALYQEHLMGTLGFDGPASLLYHASPPTRVVGTRLLEPPTLERENDVSLRMRHFQLGNLQQESKRTAPNALLGRVPILFNTDVMLSYGSIHETPDFFYRNAQADEIVFVSEGEGALESEFGRLYYRPGDYVVIPRGILHRFCPTTATTRTLVIETPSYIRFPSRYLTREGQLMDYAPFCERDIRPPSELVPCCKQETHKVIVKQNGVLTEITLDHHPLDVVGWDGCYYPWALSIHDFEPITGSLHQPPPVHQTFQADQFVICSFVPRIFDFHPEAVPAPYNHSNVMSDEVLFYANNEFMSRSGIEYGSLTLHPAGLPHGPHPGRAEDSIGKARTEELAVMLDTFRPLHVAKQALSVEDAGYSASWLES